MIDKFFMPNIDEITARDKWNELNKLTNGNEAQKFKVPVESVRYVINEKYALDRVGELSSYNSKMVMAIIQSDEKLTVFTDFNGYLNSHVVDRYDGIGIHHFQD